MKESCGEVFRMDGGIMDVDSIEVWRIFMISDFSVDFQSMIVLFATSLLCGTAVDCSKDAHEIH